MTNPKQPNALRLAQELDAYHTRSSHKEAAAELRRLHALVERLIGELEDYEPNSAHAAIAAAKEQT